MPVSDGPPVRELAAFIGARICTDGGRYWTDSSLIYELVHLGRHCDVLYLHCFVIDGERARDEIWLPPSIRLVQLGRVTSGRDLYLHPVRLLQSIATAVRNRLWSRAVLAEPGLVSLLALLVCAARRVPVAGLIRGDPAVGQVAYRHRHGWRAVVGAALRWFRVLVCQALTRTVPVIVDSDVVAARLIGQGADVHQVPAASVGAEELLPPGPGWQGAGPLRVLFVGRLERVKDLETMLEALHLAAGPRRRFVLRLVGSGDAGYTALLRARVHELGLAHSVEFAGPVAHGPDLYRQYQQAHLLALSSRSEGIPKVVIEAMAHGLPVIATRVGGLPGVLPPDAGILVPPADPAALSTALLRIHGSPGLARRMGQAARIAAAGLLAGPVSRDLGCLVTGIARPPRLRRSLRQPRRKPHTTGSPAPDPAMVRVTVAIPTRDRLALLAEAVASVRAQDISDWELIIVDDGSTDGTWDWLASIRDPRILALRADPPGERSAARNRALAAARAPYILFLDDDDRLAPGALRALLRGALRAPDAGAVIGRRVLFDDDGHRRRVRHVRRARTRWAWREVMLGWAGGVGATLWATGLVRAAGGWDERLSVAEDQDLLLRVAGRSPVRLIPRVTLEQRLHPAQRRPAAAAGTERMVRQEFLTGLDRRRQHTGRRLLESWAATRAGQRAMAGRDYGRALRCYARAIQVYPAQLLWPLVGPRIAAQGAKAAVGRVAGRSVARMAAAARTRARVLLRHAPGEYRAGPSAPRLASAGRPEAAATGQRPTGVTGLRTLLPSSLANLSTQGVLVALGLFTGIVAARVLGPAGRGELALIVLVPAIGTIAGSLGIEYGTYYLWHASDGRLRPRLLAAAAAVTTISGTVFGTVGFIIVRLLEPQAGLALAVLAAAGVPLSIANAALTMALMAQHRVTAYNLSRLAGPVAYAAMVAWLWRASALSLAAAVLAWFASLLVTVASDIALIARSQPGRPRWDPRVARRSADYGLRSYVGTMAQYGTLRLDQVLLVALAGNGALGLYYAAVSLAEFVLQIANNIGSAMMAHLGGRARDDQRRLALTTIILVGLSATAVAALLMAYGADVITLLLGRAYLPGLPALRILLPGSVLLAVARMLTGYFIAVGEARIFAQAALASLTVAIVGSVVLIPRFQASGAALASTVAYAVMLAWLAWTFRAAGPRRLAGAPGPNPGPRTPAQDLTQ